MRFALVILLVLLNHAVFAVDPAQGWYAGFLLNINSPVSISSILVNQSNNRSAIEPLCTDCRDLKKRAELSYGLGIIGIGAQAGYRIDRYRAEIEFLYQFTQYQTLRIGNLFIGNETEGENLRMEGNTALTAGFLNGYFDLRKPNMLTSVIPYVGAGIGYTRVTNKSRFFLLDTEIMGSYTALKKSVGAAQGIIGLSYYFDNTTAVSLDYRYLTSLQPVPFGFFGNNLVGFDSRFQVHSLNLTFNGMYQGV